MSSGPSGAGLTTAGGAVCGWRGQPWAAWFEGTQANLMANRMLREALLPHNAEAWPELVKQLAILGALVARAELGQGTLTLSGIKGLSQRMHTNQAVGAALPAIASQVEALEGEVTSFLQELDANQLAGSAPLLRQGTGRTAARAARSSAGATAAAAASTTKHATLSAKTPRVYPDWWPTDVNPGASHRQKQQHVAARRPPPRLAYSQPPPPLPPVHVDDVVRPELLMVRARVSGSSSDVSSDPPLSTRAKQQQKASRSKSSKVQLQHAQQLVLRQQDTRQQQEAAESGGSEHGGSPGRSTTAWMGRECVEALAAAAALEETAAATAKQEQQLTPISPRALAKWRAAFGLPAVG